MNINLNPESEEQSLSPTGSVDLSKLNLPEPVPQIPINKEGSNPWPEDLLPLGLTSGYMSPTDMTGEQWVPSESLKTDIQDINNSLATLQELLEGFQDSWGQSHTVQEAPPLSSDSLRETHKAEEADGDKSISSWVISVWNDNGVLVSSAEMTGNSDDIGWLEVTMEAVKIYMLNPNGEITIEEKRK